MKILVMGDIHGDTFGVERALEVVDADMNIQIGDFGVGFLDVEGISFKKTVHFIDGNHDDIPGLQSGAYKLHSSVKYIPRATRWATPSISFMGGAMSIDQHLRTEGTSWWREEIPTYKEFDTFAALEPSEIFITHTCPQVVIDEVFAKRMHIFGMDPVSRSLEQIRQIKAPKVWLFGHWHSKVDITIQGTRFLGIPCTHEHEGVPAYNGVLLDTDTDVVEWLVA